MSLDKLYKVYDKLNYISGHYSVESGMSFFGVLMSEPKAGECLILRGSDPLRTSPLIKITKKIYL